MYKRKNKKINSINILLQDEINFNENVMMKMIENEIDYCWSRRYI